MNDLLPAYDQGTKQSALVVATTTSFVTPFMSSSINIALPAIQREFAIDAVLLSWIATAYLLASAIFLVPFGRLADIRGRKRIFLYGIAIFTLASLVSGLSTSTPMLLAARVAQGAGSAMIFATGMAILISVYPPQERGKVLGISVAAVYTGLSLGPFCGGLLIQHFGWRSIFLINIPLGVFVILLVLRKLKGEWAEAAEEKFDLVGALIYGPSLVAVIYGITSLPGVTGGLLIAGGIAGMILFVRWELRTAHPVFEVTLFRANRVFALSSLAALIHYGATFAVTFLVSLYLQYIKGLPPEQAGMVLVSQPLVMALLSPLAGRLSDKIEPRVVASLGMGVTTLALAWLALLDEGTSMTLILARLVLLGFGYALFSSPNTNAIMSSVERRFYGIASGAVGTMRLLGMMLSMGIATMIIALVIGRVEITPENYAGFVRCVDITLIISAVMCAGGTMASLARGQVRG